MFRRVPSSLLSGSSSIFLRHGNSVVSRKSTMSRFFSRVASRRASSSSAAAKAAVTTEATPGEGPGGEGDFSALSYFGVLFRRLTLSLGIVYVVTEYGIEWTVCEGPSMMPTIKPRGEIVVIDRLTPKMWGLSGGDTVAKRTEFAEKLQREHVANTKRRRQRERESLLRFCQQEEERLSLQRKQRQEQQQEHHREEEEEGTDRLLEKRDGHRGGNTTKMMEGGEGTERSSIRQHHQESTPQEITTPTHSLVSNPGSAQLEQESQPLSGSSSSRDPTATKKPGTQAEETTGLSLEAALEKLAAMGEEEAEEDATWYETRIPVNVLPPEGAWGRFRNQITTGISVGDVVVLQHPNRIGTVCKRVMGLPGDIVTKPSSRLAANRLETMLSGGPSGGRSQPFVVETAEQRRRRHRRSKRRMLSSGIMVPDGHIWVEGDNPWNSSDSRNYGTVPAGLIMGRVLFRLWPLRGKAIMERGDRPRRSKDDEASLAFSGSIVVPAGWNDQRIVRECLPRDAGLPATPNRAAARKQKEE